MKRGLARLLVLLIALGALGSCGKEDGGLSDAASALLAPRVEAIKAAAAAGDRATAEAEAARLRQTLEELKTAGTIDTDEATRVLEALAGVEQQLGLIPTTTTTTAPAPVPLQDDADHGKGKDKKRGEDD